jgi:hypothetical protein
MNLRKALAGATLLAPLMMLLSTESVLAAGTTVAKCPKPTDITGIGIVSLNNELCNSLGPLASIYVSAMNGLVIATMALFTFVSVKHVLTALKKSHDSGDEGIGQDGGGTADATATHVRNAVVNVLESGAITLIILFVITNGANMLLQAATGAGGLFSLDPSKSLGKFMGPLGPATNAIQLWASYAVIALGAAIAVWKSIGVLKKDSYTDHQSGGGLMAGQSKTEFAKTQALVKELMYVGLLVIIAFVVIRFGPELVIQTLSGVQSLGTGSEVPTVVPGG